MSPYSPLWGDDLVPDDWVAVKGYFPGIILNVGDWIAFEADWKKHKKFGLQLVVKKAPSVEALREPKACAGLLRHVGVRLSKRPEPGWEKPLPDLMGRPQELSEYLGIQEEEALRVYHLWDNFQKGFSSLAFLASAGLPKSKVREIVAVFGYEIENLLKKDPWILGKIPGIRFSMQDEIAHHLKVSLSSYERTRGAVRQCILSSSHSGHLFMTTGDLFKEITKLIGDRPKEDVAKALKDLREEDEIHIDSETRPGVKAIYEKQRYFLETECAKKLAKRVKEASLEGDSDYLQRVGGISDEVTEAFEAGANLREICLLAAVAEGHRLRFDLSPEQLEGVLGGLIEPVSIITGLPGTGKTTSLSVLVFLLMEMGISILLIAPTAIAAKRMTALTGHPAYTVHRAFGAKKEPDDEDEETDESRYIGVLKKASKKSERGIWREWEYGSGADHPARVVVCDEASMIDQHLLFRILDCTRSDARLVFVGDSAQLPSVGPGDVLRNLISSGVFPVTSLVQIFRQDETNDIIEAAHQIHRGEMPEVGDRKRDFLMLPASSEEKASKIIVRIAEKLFQKVQENKKSGKEIGSFQVLSPRHRGEAGVTNLNSVLREVINPGRDNRYEAKIGFDVVREGDRIMVVENNYDLDIYNGDIGKISIIDRKNREAKIKLFGSPSPRYLTMKFREVARYLRLAYACTVHKYQGLEVDTVIIPVLRSFGWQLQRNLFYTAITRAKKKVILVGQEECLWRAIQNNREDQRNTFLSLRLQQLVGGEHGD
ncbi:MAG: AAA family ATPase [Candidatus Altiarchaeales archaeon]|nr:AAA family ATPase [Candidatus Altiarchaeales archaeon]